MPVDNQTEEEYQVPDDSHELQAELDCKVQEMASIRERMFTDAASGSTAHGRHTGMGGR